MAISSPPPRGTVLVAVLFVVTAVGGCSGTEAPLAPVEGTVTRGGRPVAHAQVIFMADGDSKGPRAMGITDESGHFRLTLDDGKDGAPVGHHRVCVVDTTAAAERFGMAAKRLAPDKALLTKPVGKSTPIPATYGRPEETPLRADVRAGGSQTIDFQIP
ncbi:Uncharacterized protein OS=Planctomyces maris DSM 8797 GN=PM8797T_26895 PE=4 SV=1 [Gemmata massiliana]|uniref:Carboxypeptidase regulatory-like domain-containing protein n=1 Tax=Gemmata massiliana TaxID=1210884 RepID=A0A6P2D5F9_9BACT|nr:carboxypeptidase regulatory-like domain-containing protein [Gemmata massiliana]VTR94712.1 Uncharacterized protein OS=Planctomyces maris DSM 8797 GN=PM8797T_26895 PE=4 SV=1 [Gemmata massiliana]